MEESITKSGKIGTSNTIARVNLQLAMLLKSAKWHQSEEKVSSKSIKNVDDQSVVCEELNVKYQLAKPVVKEEMVVIESRRKSVSDVELNVESVAAFTNVKIRAVDMPVVMQVHAFRCARRTYDTLDQFSSKHMAYSIKKEFDKTYGAAWHCIVGSDFGSFVTHSTGGFIYFSMENIHILLFKTRVNRAYYAGRQ